MRPRISDIITVAGRLTNVPPSEIVSDRRFLYLCAIRYPVYLTAREWGFSLSEIGRVVGRDHTSVYHGLQTGRRFEGYVNHFDEFCAEVARWSDELPPFVSETDWQPDRKFHVFLTDGAKRERSKQAKILRAARSEKIARRLGGEMLEAA
jgi:hypothetical protein